MLGAFEQMLLYWRAWALEPHVGTGEIGHDTASEGGSEYSVGSLESRCFVPEQSLLAAVFDKAEGPTTVVRIADRVRPNRGCGL